VVGLQALVLVAVLQLVAGLDAVRVFALFGFAVLTGLTFAAITQALVAAFGRAGQVVLLILVALQLASAGASYPIETAPGLFRVLHDVLPLGYAVQGLRACIAGGAGIGTPALALLIWLALALLVTLAVAARRRTTTVARLHRPALT